MPQATAPGHIVRLLELAHRSVEQHLAAIARADGDEVVLTNAQSRLLQMVPPQGVTATALAQRARVTKQGLGQMVDILEHRGLVTRQQHPSDGRSRLIVRTSAGDLATARLARRLHRLDQRLAELLGTEAYEGFQSALATIADCETNAEAEPVPDREPAADPVGPETPRHEG